MKQFSVVSADGNFLISTVPGAKHAQETSREQSLTLVIRPVDGALERLTSVIGSADAERVLREQPQKWAERLQAVLDDAFGHYGHEARMDALHTLAEQKENARSVGGAIKNIAQNADALLLGLGDAAAEGGFHTEIDGPDCFAPKKKIKLHIALEERVVAGHTLPQTHAVLPRIDLPKTEILHAHPDFLDEVERVVVAAVRAPEGVHAKPPHWGERSAKIIEHRNESGAAQRR